MSGGHSHFGLLVNLLSGLSESQIREEMWMIYFELHSWLPKLIWKQKKKKKKSVSACTAILNLVNSKILQSPRIGDLRIEDFNVFRWGKF